MSKLPWQTVNNCIKNSQKRKKKAWEYKNKKDKNTAGQISNLEVAELS